MSSLLQTEAVIREGIEAGRHPGAQLYVSREGTPLAEWATGMARPGRPMKTESRVLWMSCVKPVVAVALAQLFEQGRVELDERVAQHVPEFGCHGKEAITLRHLLTHTGGFRGADIGLPSARWREAVDHICAAKAEPRWVPGQKAGYHAQCSWFMLGEVVRRVSGTALDVYVRERIFAPLGITQSGIGIPVDEQPGVGDLVAFMYHTADNDLEPYPVYSAQESVAAINPAGNGRGPIRDLARFYEMLLAGGTWNDHAILRPETVKIFTGRQRVGMEDATFRQHMDWGLGFACNNYGYHREQGRYGFGPHASDQSFGHGGSQSSLAFADPENGLVVAVAFNGMPGEEAHQARMLKVLEAVYRDLELA